MNLMKIDKPDRKLGSFLI